MIDIYLKLKIIYNFLGGYMNLSIEEKIGQRFIFGVNSSDVRPIIELIKNAYIGGVILYKRNYKSYEDMLELIGKLKEANKDNKIPY